MGYKRVTNEDLELVVNELVRNGVHPKDLMKMHSLTKHQIYFRLEKAVETKLLSKKDYAKWAKGFAIRGYQTQLKTLGEAEYLKRRRKLWRENVGSFDALSDAGKIGGKRTNDLHPKKMKKNLSNYKTFGKNKCTYDDAIFGSHGERVVALVLLEYGILPNLAPGVYFQKGFEGEKYKIDFYVNETLIIEYHPLTPFDKEKGFKTINSWKKNRQKELSDHFNGDIVVIDNHSPSRIYLHAEELGINDSWHKFLDKYNKIKSDIKEYERQTSFDFSMPPVVVDETPAF